MDKVFATAKPGSAYVFRHNYLENKWENVTNRKDGSASVMFRKRGNMFFMRIVPEGGTKEEHELSHNAEIKDSGDGFIQVPLPDKKQLIGIKFRQKEEAHIFLGKIREEMDITTPMVMQAVVLDEKAISMFPNPDQLPKAMVTGYGAGLTTLPATINPRKPAPPPPQENYDNLPGVGEEGPGQPHDTFDGQPAPLPPRPAPWSGSVGQRPVPNSPQFNTGQPVLNTGQPPLNTGQPPFNAEQAPFYSSAQVPYHGGQPTGQPQFYPEQQAYNPGQPVKAHRVMVSGAAGGHGVIQGHAPAPQLAPQPDLRPLPRAEPEVPSFSTGEEAISDHASFLANAINAGKFEAAYRLINMLEKTKSRRRMVITYPDEPNTMADDVEVTLDMTIEFQSQHKSKLQLYLDFKAGLTIKDIQQHLELSHHIPKATQSWIIGGQLVKGEMLTKTLRDFGIDGARTKAKVFIYVMHSKKAQVPKEEYEAIRQCQQEERERKKQGLKPPWKMTASEPPPAVPPRQHMEPDPQPQPRRQAWGQPVVEDDHVYSRVNREMPAPTMPPPPTRIPMNPDPTYQHLHNFQQHPAESRPHPHHAPSVQPRFPPDAQYPVGGVGYSAGHAPSQQPNMSPHQLQPMMGGYPQQYQAPQPPQQYQAPQPPQQYQVPQQYPAPQPPQQHPAPQPPQQYQAPQPPQQRPPLPEATKPKPPADPPKIGWPCPKCTFINKPRRPGCEICAADRPEDYQVPDDLPLDPDEVRIMAGLQGCDSMFQEYAEEQKKREERERVRNFQALLQAEEEEALVTNDEAFDCPICLTDVEPGEGVRLRGCLHLFCKDCLKESIMASPDAEVKCPFRDNKYECNVPIPEREIRQLVNEDDLQKLYRKGLQEAETAAANSYHCKTTNCEGFCFYEDEVNEFNCPICKKVNCLTCKAIHEGINCQEYQDDLRRRAANDEAAKATQDMLDQMLKDGNAMNCPSCKIVVQKKDGCDWIRCSVCKTEICWATKQARWGPKGKGDKTGGCHCRENSKKCHPLCRNCH